MLPRRHWAAGAGNGAATAALLFDGSDVTIDNDGGHLDALTLVLTNHAPVLDNTGDMTLTTVLEDDTNPAGDTVADIIASAGGDRITDRMPVPMKVLPSSGSMTPMDSGSTTPMPIIPGLPLVA